MTKERPSKAGLLKRLTRGADIALPGGWRGVFIEFFSGGKTSAKVLCGGLDGPLTNAPVAGILKATWGFTSK